MTFMMRAAEVFRDFVTSGVPSSGKWEPKKSDIRVWGSWVEDSIAAFLTAGGSIYQTRVSLNGDLSPAANSMAWVIEDPVAANNGIYRKTGTTGSGTWVRVADLPFSFIVASSADGGTPNSLQVSTAIPPSVSALILFPVAETNTASPVTVSLNDGPDLTIKTNSGNDVAVGGLVAGMIALGLIAGSTFRLVSDQASAAILAQMESLAASVTETVEEATSDAISTAQAAATEAQMYADMVGAAVYDFSFDSDPDQPGYDWSN